MKSIIFAIVTIIFFNCMSDTYACNPGETETQSMKELVGTIEYWKPTRCLDQYTTIKELVSARKYILYERTVNCIEENGEYIWYYGDWIAVKEIIEDIEVIGNVTEYCNIKCEYCSNGKCISKQPVSPSSPECL